MSEFDNQTSGNAPGKMPSWFFWSACAVLTAVYFCCALVRIAELPLIDPDEPRYAGAGRSMATGGSLLIPEFNGAPRVNKPPLFYWTVALSDTLAGGATETSSRAPSVFFGLLMLWGTVFLGRRLFDATTGLIGGLALATMPLFVALSRMCVTDMTLSLFLAATMGVLILGLTGRAPPKKALWIASILFGCAVLTKAIAVLGLILAIVLDRAMSLSKEQRPAAARWIPATLIVAMIFSAAAIQCDALARAAHLRKVAKNAARAERPVAADEIAIDVTKPSGWATVDSALNIASIVLAISVVVLLMYMAARAEYISPMLPRGWKLALGLSFAMGLWWYVLLIFTHGWPRFVELLDFEIRQRLYGTMHRQGMHFYLLAIPALTFPWSVGLPGALGVAWPGTASADTTSSIATDASRIDRFLIAWILGIVFFFSIPGAKLETYVLATLPPLALLIARFIARIQARDVSRFWLNTTTVLAVALGVILLVVPLCLRLIVKNADSELHGKKGMIWAVAIGAALVFSGSWLLALKGRGRWSAPILGIAMFVLYMVLEPTVIDRLKTRSSRVVCEKIGDALKDCKRIVTLGLAPESLSYYLNHAVVEIRERPPVTNEPNFQLLTKWIGTDEMGAVFIDRKSVPRIFGKNADTAHLDTTELKRILPPSLIPVYSDSNVIVVRSARTRSSF